MKTAVKRRVILLATQYITVKAMNRLYHKRVVVTGLGVVSPLGVGTKYFWNNLLRGECGIVAMKDDRFSKLPSRVAGFVPREANADGKFDEKLFTENERRQFSNSSLYTVCAAEEALCDANWKPVEPEQLEYTGVSIGSSIMGLDYLFQAENLMKTNSYRKVHPHTIPRALINIPAGYVNIKYGFMGASNCVSTACATGAHSIVDGYNLIRNDDCKVVVCGAADSEISPAVVAGFCRCKALSTKYNDDPIHSSRPFDKERDGFVISEGAGVLVIEDYDHAKARNAKIYCEILGYGLSSDAYHITNPHPDATGVILCMDRAIKNSSIEKSDVCYINAHSTSTPVGDKIEALAIKTVFESDYKNIRVSSIKGSIGHLLAAAGSVESIATILYCSTGLLPPSINVCDSDDIDLNIVETGDRSSSNESHVRRIALKNSFGFGGTNCCLCFASISS